MKKASKTRATVRELFREDFKDPDFVVWFEEERAKSEIALRIARARKAAGLTQAELAKRVDTTQSVIARLESGSDRRMPSLPLLARVFAALNKRLVLEFKDIKRAS